MADLSTRRLELATMLAQVEQVVSRGRHTDPPAFTLILGAGASHGVVPTARQMLGLPDRGIYHEACIPAYLYEQNHGEAPKAEDLPACVAKFWKEFSRCNDGQCPLKFPDGVPQADAVPEAYKLLFSEKHVGGLNSPGDARDYLRHVTMGKEGRIKLNGTHFYLGSLLSLQNRRPDERGAAERSLYIGRRPFARTIFTTNFDPLLQVSLQLFQNLYYMTDRPELLPTDALQTDDHPAVHLFYAHGSVHRPGPKNTEAEIDGVKQLNANAIAPYLATHGVIVLGYSGWDDCLLQALKECTSFRHNLYWLCRGEASLSEKVRNFLLANANAKWVPIQDGATFMADLHRRLCPGMANTELLANPIPPLRERLGRVDLAGIPSFSAGTSSSAAARSEADAERPITPEDLRRQVVNLLEKMETQFTGTAPAEDALLEVQKLEHRADLAYSNKDYPSALTIYSELIRRQGLAPRTKALALFRRAVCQREAGRNDDAIVDSTSAIDLPGAPQAQVAKALVNRAVCHGRAGRNDEAIGDYTRAIELPGAQPEQVAMALFNRAVCHGQAGRNDEGIADYTRAIELPGAPPEQVAKALFNRALCHGRAGRNDEEIADYTRTIELHGAQPDQVAKALVNRAVCHGQAERNDQEIGDYARAIELPGAPLEEVEMALFNRAVCHRQAGRNDEAIRDYARAIELPGTQPERVAKALVNRGSCHKQAGRNHEATADFKRAIDLPGAPVPIVEEAKSQILEMEPKTE